MSESHKADALAAEGAAKGKVEVSYMEADHPIDPKHHVQAVIDATNAGVYDYR